MLNSTVGVRRGGLTSPFKHKYGDPVSFVRTSPSTTPRTHMLYHYIWKERKEMKVPKGKKWPWTVLVWSQGSTDGWPYHWVFVFGCDCTICYYMLWCVIHISFSTYSLVFCSSVLPGCGKCWLKIYNLDQRISTVGQQQCIKNYDLIH